jgi:prevent-host-death family protein
MTSREARVKWRDLLDRVFAGNSDVVIERNGKPVAVMISVTDYEDIQDELDDVRAARRVSAIYDAWKADSSIGRPWEEAKEELIAAGKLDE